MHNYSFPPDSANIHVRAYFSEGLINKQMALQALFERDWQKSHYFSANEIPRQTYTLMLL